MDSLPFCGATRPLHTENRHLFRRLPNLFDSLVYQTLFMLSRGNLLHYLPNSPHHLPKLRTDGHHEYLSLFPYQPIRYTKDCPSMIPCFPNQFIQLCIIGIRTVRHAVIYMCIDKNQLLFNRLFKRSMPPPAKILNQFVYPFPCLHFRTSFALHLRDFLSLSKYRYNSAFRRQCLRSSLPGFLFKVRSNPPYIPSKRGADHHEHGFSLFFF